MKKSIYTLVFLASLTQLSYGQTIPIPNNYSIIGSATGDLDKDSIAELVVAYNTASKNEIEGTLRELIIYKLNNNQWIEWKKSNQALYGSKGGGMMGDTFGDIKIKNGILLISQNGGSSWKWSMTDKYRFQNNEFYLIGYTSTEGSPCEYWTNVDFNLSVGKMIVKKEYEKCGKKGRNIYKRESETLKNKRFKIRIQNRQEREIKITTPKYGHDIYIAIGKE